MPGGLIDLEFIAQVAQLGGEAPGEGRVTGTAEVLSRLSSAFATAAPGRNSPTPSHSTPRSPR